MFSADISVTKSVCGPKLYSNYNLCVNDNLHKGCKFTNDKGTLHWSHTEPLMLMPEMVEEGKFLFEDIKSISPFV